MEKTKTLIALGLVLAGLVATPAHATEAEPQPQIEWSDSTRLALAQCLVGEAGWGTITEYVVIAHVLRKRWEAVIKQPQYADWTFETMARKYCAVHRVSSPTPRQEWVRALPWGPLEGNPGFGGTVQWRYYARHWDRTREIVAKFENGEFEDPFPSATFWGGPMDHARLGDTDCTRQPPPQPQEQGKGCWQMLPGIVKSVEDGKKPVQLQNYYYRYVWRMPKQEALASK